MNDVLSVWLTLRVCVCVCVYVCVCEAVWGTYVCEGPSHGVRL